MSARRVNRRRPSVLSVVEPLEVGEEENVAIGLEDITSEPDAIVPIKTSTATVVKPPARKPSLLQQLFGSPRKKVKPKTTAKIKTTATVKPKVKVATDKPKAKTTTVKPKVKAKKRRKVAKAKTSNFIQRLTKRVVRLLQPWKLPDDWPKTNDMTDKELAEEARAQQHLLKDKGIFDSALTNFPLMNRQYLRVCQYSGVLPIKPYVVFYALPVVLAIVFAAVLAMAVQGNQSATSNLDTSWITGAVFGVMLGLFIGLIVGYPTMAVMQFNKAYARALAFQVNEFDEPQQCFGVPVLRMACIDNPGLVFTGSGEDAGFDTGDLLLRAPDGIDISNMTYSNDVCTWESMEGSFIGTNAREEWSLQTLAEMTGKANPRGKGNKTTGQVMKEWSGVLIFLGAFVGCIFLLASQPEETTTIVNPASVPAPTDAPPNIQPWNTPVPPTIVPEPEPDDGITDAVPPEPEPDAAPDGVELNPDIEQKWNDATKASGYVVQWSPP